MAVNATPPRRGAAADAHGAADGVSGKSSAASLTGLLFTMLQKEGCSLTLDEIESRGAAVSAPPPVAAGAWRRQCAEQLQKFIAAAGVGKPARSGPFFSDTVAAAAFSVPSFTPLSSPPSVPVGDAPAPRPPSHEPGAERAPLRRSSAPRVVSAGRRQQPHTARCTPSPPPAPSPRHPQAPVDVAAHMAHVGRVQSARARPPPARAEDAEVAGAPTPAAEGPRPPGEEPSRSGVGMGPSSARQRPATAAGAGIGGLRCQRPIPPPRRIGDGPTAEWFARAAGPGVLLGGMRVRVGGRTHAIALDTVVVAVAGVTAWLSGVSAYARRVRRASSARAPRPRAAFPTSGLGAEAEGVGQEFCDVPGKQFYTILKATPSTGAGGLKKLYHTACMQYHPDRHVRATETERKHAAEMFRSATKAYHVLSDPILRRAYDIEVGVYNMPRGRRR